MKDMFDCRSCSCIKKSILFILIWLSCCSKFLYTSLQSAGLGKLCLFLHLDLCFVIPIDKDERACSDDTITEVPFGGIKLKWKPVHKYDLFVLLLSDKDLT